MTDITPETRAALISQGWTPPPKPVDPLLLMAREICEMVYDRGHKGIGWNGGVKHTLTKLREAQALVQRPIIDREKILAAMITAPHSSIPIKEVYSLASAAIKAIERGQ